MKTPTLLPAALRLSEGLCSALYCARLTGELLGFAFQRAATTVEAKQSKTALMREPAPLTDALALRCIG